MCENDCEMLIVSLVTPITCLRWSTECWERLQLNATDKQVAFIVENRLNQVFGCADFLMPQWHTVLESCSKHLAKMSLTFDNCVEALKSPAKYPSLENLKDMSREGSFKAHEIRD